MLNGIADNPDLDALFGETAAEREERLSASEGRGSMGGGAERSSTVWVVTHG